MTPEEKYELLLKKLRSIFHPLTSNICLICKYYGSYNTAMRLDRVIIKEGEFQMGCNIPTGKCMFEPNEDKLNEQP